MEDTTILIEVLSQVFGLFGSIMGFIMGALVITLTISFFAPIVFKCDVNYRIGFLGFTLLQVQYTEKGYKVRVFCKNDHDEAKKLLQWLKDKDYLTAEWKPLFEEYTEK